MSLLYTVANTAERILLLRSKFTRKSSPKRSAQFLTKAITSISKRVEAVGGNPLQVLIWKP